MKIDDIKWTSNCGCGEQTCAGLFVEMAVPNGALVITTAHDENDDVYHVARRSVESSLEMPVTRMTGAELELLLPESQELPLPPVLV